MNICQLKIRVVIFLAVVLLSGCAGYSIDRNAKPVEKSVTSEDSFWTFGIENIKNLPRPSNGVQRYDEKTRWCGLTVWAIIPIPLWLPACNSYTEVTFVNGKPIKRVDQHLEYSNAFVCGPFPWIANRFNGGGGFCMDH